VGAAVAVPVLSALPVSAAATASTAAAVVVLADAAPMTGLIFGLYGAIAGILVLQGVMAWWTSRKRSAGALQANPAMESRIAQWIDQRVDNAENNIVEQLTTPERLQLVANTLTPIIVPAVVDAVTDKIGQLTVSGFNNVISSVNTHTDNAAHAIVGDINAISGAVAAAPGQIIQGVISGIKGVIPLPFLQREEPQMANEGITISPQDVQSGLQLLNALSGVVEQLPFVPVSVRHGLEDLQKVLQFVTQVQGAAPQQQPQQQPQQPPAQQPTAQQ
jgi:hypothetical protein